MPISPVGSTTNFQAQPLTTSAASAASSLGHSEEDHFEFPSEDELRLQSNIVAAFMRMKEGGNTDAENVADQKTIDESMEELEAIQKAKTKKT